LCCFGIGCGAPGAEAPLPEPSPGYPETTSRLKLSLGGDYWKLCHATLVDARWALTAAHCFSGVDPDAPGALNDFNRSVATKKLAKVARMFRVNGDSDETLAFECAGAVRKLRERVGLPNGLAAEGITEEQLAKLADLALVDPCHQENPRPCTRDDLLSLYRASM